jgi:hypothetical protein
MVIAGLRLVGFNAERVGWALEVCFAGDPLPTAGFLLLIGF